MQQREEAQQGEQSTSRNIKMNIGGDNPKLSSNLKHSKASLKKLYKSRLTYKKSWEEKYFLYVLISIGENHRGGSFLCNYSLGLIQRGGGGGGGARGGRDHGIPPPCRNRFLVFHRFIPPARLPTTPHIRVGLFPLEQKVFFS